MWKYDVLPQMCRGTCVANNELITKSYNNNKKTNDGINTSIIAEIIKIRDDTINQCDANDIVMQVLFDNHVVELSATP